MSQTKIPQAITDGGTILATVNIAAAPGRLFRALTTDEVERWWGSADTYRQTDWVADLRPGGRWSVGVHGVDGSTHPASGEFLEIDAPYKVVLTRQYDRDFPVLGRRETTVTYRLDPVPAGTRVTVRQDGFAGLWEPAGMHVQGWERVLVWLQDYMQSESSAAAA